MCFVIHYLSTLVNYVLDTAPQQWKLGEVALVYKKNCGLDKSNYSPLTILPSLTSRVPRVVRWLERKKGLLCSLGRRPPLSLHYLIFGDIALFYNNQSKYV